MSNFEKELEKNMELNKVAYKIENIYSGFLVSKRDIERIFHDWQPPKPLVVVPQFVADWFEKNEDDLSFKIWGYLINWKLQDKKSDFFRWMKKESECIEILIHMQDGYTVKKEQLYEVIINGLYLAKLMKCDDSKSHRFIEKDKLVNWQETGYRLTAKQIKMIDKRYMAFAVKVDEVEP